MASGKYNLYYFVNILHLKLQDSFPNYHFSQGKSHFKLCSAKQRSGNEKRDQAGIKADALVVYVISIVVGKV